MQHSEKFKASMVRKMLGPSAMSANRLSKECGVRQPTLSTWLRQAKLGGMPTKSRAQARKRWTPEEKMRVVLAAAAAGDRGVGEVLRREGLHDADLVHFQQELIRASKPQRGKRDAGDRKRIKELERELRRKDRALAEATALVVLSKKLRAYFGVSEVGDTSEESEK